jgi:ATP-dependent 26S proteasome regulatory subunit
VIQFFSPEVAELHRAMKVRYRRGVLLHGPPGNGKTSTIRHLGAMLPKIPGLILRAKSNFDTDDFENVVTRWRKMAPAMLVIEDLNWLLEEVNVSAFLNLIDGVDSATTVGGLLLLATTNHPDTLDPAINSRPGRFDVVIELPPPDLGLRKEFFARSLEEISPDMIRRLAGNTPDMSFAHLEEIVRLAGLLAIKAGRPRRSVEDLEEALTSVKNGIEQVEKGFARELEVPFGLRPRRAEE